MNRMHIALGCVAIALFMGLLGLGFFIDSRPYRSQLLALSGPEVAVAAPDQPGAAADRGPRKPVGISPAKAFAIAMVTFTPMNVAFLSLLAGFLGGCASQITYTRSSPAALTETQAAFRTESPFASMFRGFVVYLAFIAGVTVATADPFASTTADSYLRLAGTLSFFAFVVGYDPTKFQEWLRSAGAPAKTAKT